MADVTRYAIPASRHRAEQVIDRSRFICSLASATSPDEAHAFIHEMNVEFPDASHNCWAFVLGPAGSTDRIGMTDDGEPHGTAGRPMLTVLTHSGVGDIAAVVTRYFGGTKLGTGGLVKAYSTASTCLASDTKPMFVLRFVCRLREPPHAATGADGYHARAGGYRRGKSRRGLRTDELQQTQTASRAEARRLGELQKQKMNGVKCGGDIAMWH